MEFWEFLLQKEGDRSWLPLESPNVEILEGRYRVVARSSRPNTILEIKVTQQDLNEMPPVRRIQKRPGKTNPQGLVVVMPFTRLQPGDWELRCTGDLMDDMLGNGWSQMVLLQVVPIELDSGWHDDEYTEVNLTGAQGAVSSAANDSEPGRTVETESLSQVSVPPIELPIAPIAIPKISVDRSPVWAEPVEAEIAAEVPKIAAIEEAPFPEAQSPEAQSPEIQSPEMQSVATTVIPSPTERQPLRLCLTQETWVIQRNQSLTLTGKIAALEERLGSSAIPCAPIQGQLHVRLFDPQNSQMLIEQYYHVPEHQPLPIAFACELSLPASSPTYLILGEVALYDVAQAGELPPVLATQSFNVTTELYELLETIANNFPNPDLVPPPQARSKDAQVAEVDLSFFNISPVTQTLLNFQSSEQNSLPPHLHPTDPAKVHRLDLPSFAVSDAANGDRVNGDRVNGDRPDADPEETHPYPEDHTPLQETPVLDSAVIAEIVAKISTSAKAEPANFENPAPPQTFSEDSFAPEAAIAPIEAEPTAIERVDELIGDWDEDWEIAADGTLNWRQVQPKKPASPEDRAFQSLNLQNRFLNRLQTLATDPEISDWLREPAAVVRANPIDQEIVVDDDEPYQPKPDPTLSFSQDAEPVPIPQMKVPPGDLVAGQPINIIVKLPKSDTRIYAKLWIRDRQLRVLIESPRWLIDFKPDGFGALKAQTTVTLPLGCMEVQFEAIAIEMTHQSESQKTIVHRSVISPELSAVSLEELDE